MPRQAAKTDMLVILRMVVIIWGYIWFNDGSNTFRTTRLQCRLTVCDERFFGSLVKNTSRYVPHEVTTGNYQFASKILQNFVLFTWIQIYANWQLQPQDVRLKKRYPNDNDFTPHIALIQDKSQMWIWRFNHLRNPKVEPLLWITCEGLFSEPRNVCMHQVFPGCPT